MTLACTLKPTDSGAFRKSTSTPKVLPSTRRVARQKAIATRDRIVRALGSALGAMGSACASNKAIPLPELGPLRSWLIPPRGKRKPKGGGEGGASGTDR